MLGKDPKNALKSAAYSYIMEDLGLFKDGVEFDRHGKLVFRNGVLDPKTGLIGPHSPDHFATWRIDVVYDPTATAPRLMDYLRLITTDFGEEAAAVIAVLQEWFGILIHTGVKTREMMVCTDHLWWQLHRQKPAFHHSQVFSRQPGLLHASPRAGAAFRLGGFARHGGLDRRRRVLPD